MLPRCCLMVFLCCLLMACGSPQGKREGVSLERAAIINVQLGSEYMAQGRLEMAKEKLEKALEQNSSLPDAHAAYGMLMGKLGKLKDAEKHFKKALNKDPHNSGFLNNYGSFLCDQARVQEAEKYFLQALDDPLYRTPEYAYGNAGTCALKISDYEKAESYLRKALQINPNFLSALYQMAQLFNQRQQYKLSKAYLDRYHEHGYQTAESLWLAVQLSKKLGDRDAEASYVLLLKRKFPESEQAQLLNSQKTR